MPRYVTRVRSPWPAPRAFEYLSDLERFAEWDPGVTRASRVAGAGPGPGAAYDVTVRAMGRDLTLRYETVGFDPPRRVEVHAETSTLRSRDVIAVSDDPGGGCVVTYDAELSLKGLLRAGDPLLRLAFRRIGDRAAAGLRAALEGAAP
ncbi:MAG TPA: SRPBCC family protein [Acidimicrobiia bacterium]